MEQFAGRSCTVIISKFFQESFTADPSGNDGVFYGPMPTVKVASTGATAPGELPGE